MAMDLFDGLFLTLDCPNCDYGMDVEILSVRLETMTLCPCCKLAIQLVDADASVHGAQEKIGSALNDLEDQLKELNKTTRFEI